MASITISSVGADQWATISGVQKGVIVQIGGTFSGSFGTQDLLFFYGNTVHAGYIRNLSYSERPVW